MSKIDEIQEKIKGLVKDLNCMGTCGLIELELRELVKESYNQALEDAVCNAEINERDCHMQYSPNLDDQSILKLRKRK